MKPWEKITAERFQDWAVHLSDLKAVPMLVIGTPVAGNLTGQIVALNSQGRGPAEVIALLKSITADLEASLQ